MKPLLKLIVGLTIGIIAGLLIGAVGCVLFTDTTFAEFGQKLVSTSFLEAVGAALVGIVSFIVSIALIIPAHEAGHLVCGLLTGYKFVSFRILNYTFIKVDGRVQVKRFSVAGTGGQCLLTPPDVPLERIPTGWYNAGGVLFNVSMMLIVVPFLWVDLNTFVYEALIIFCIVDAIVILMNGIPMKLGGIGNDAYNMLYLRHNMTSKRALVIQLRSNALIQNGVRSIDMPDEWFEWKTDIDYKNPLEVSIPFMYASRLVDELSYEDAYLKYEELYSHKADIMQLYVNEIACELAFCAMVTGREDRAREILDTKLTKYIDSYRHVMSSKQRILCAKALFIDNNPTKAVDIYDELNASKERYLLQGEVRSDLAIIEDFLTTHQ